jgi:hypothetical protein
VTHKRYGVLLAVICAAGLGLRLQGLGYGLPAVYNMDEVAIMNRALAFGTGDFNPKNFVYPTFYFYVLFAWEGLTFLAGLAMGWWDSLAAFQREFFLDPTRLYWSGRLLSTLCGVATIAVVGVWTARMAGRAAGLLAAAVMAIAPIAIMDAHYVKHDVPVTLLIMLVHRILGRIMMTGGAAARRDVWVAGALAGLATSTHYYAVFVVLPVAAILLTQPGVSWADRWRDGLRAGAAALIVFIAASPFFLPELSMAWRDITQNREIVMDRATEATGWFSSLGRYVTLFRDFGTSLLVPLFGVAGFLGGGRRARLFLLFPVAFLLFISNTVPATRYLNPLLPFFAAGTGMFVARLMINSLAWKSVWSRRLAWTVVTMFFVVPGLLRSLQLGMFFNQTDTRTLARQWIETQVPAGSTVLVQPYSVPLRQSREGLAEALRATLGSEDRATVKFQQQLALSPYPAPAYRTIYLGDGGLDKDKIYVSPRAFESDGTLAPLRAAGVQYVVLKRYNAPDASLAALDTALAAGGHLVAMFSPYRSAERRPDGVAPFLHNTDARLDRALERPGPVIEIWRLDAARD